MLTQNDKDKFPHNYKVRYEYTDGTVLTRDHLNVFEADDEYRHPIIVCRRETDLFSVTVFQNNKPIYGSVAHNV